MPGFPRSILEHNKYEQKGGKSQTGALKRGVGAFRRRVFVGEGGGRVGFPVNTRGVRPLHLSYFPSALAAEEGHLDAKGAKRKGLVRIRSRAAVCLHAAADIDNRWRLKTEGRWTSAAIAEERRS